MENTEQNRKCQCMVLQVHSFRALNLKGLSSSSSLSSVDPGPPAGPATVSDVFISNHVEGLLNTFNSNYDKALLSLETGFELHRLCPPGMRSGGVLGLRVRLVTQPPSAGALPVQVGSAGH